MPTKRQRGFRISGRVIDRKSGRGVARLRVEAWDKDLVFSDPVGIAATKAGGVFRIEFSEKVFREGFEDRRPELSSFSTVGHRFLELLSSFSTVGHRFLEFLSSKQVVKLSTTTPHCAS